MAAAWRAYGAAALAQPRGYHAPPLWMAPHTPRSQPRGHHAPPMLMAPHTPRSQPPRAPGVDGSTQTQIPALRPPRAPSVDGSHPHRARARFETFRAHSPTHSPNRTGAAARRKGALRPDVACGLWNTRRQRDDEAAVHHRTDRLKAGSRGLTRMGALRHCLRRGVCRGLPSAGRAVSYLSESDA